MKFRKLSSKKNRYYNRRPMKGLTCEHFVEKGFSRMRKRAASTTAKIRKPTIPTPGVITRASARRASAILAAVVDLDDVRSDVKKTVGMSLRRDQKTIASDDVFVRGAAKSTNAAKVDDANFNTRSVPRNASVVNEGVLNTDTASSSVARTDDRITKLRRASIAGKGVLIRAPDRVGIASTNTITDAFKKTIVPIKNVITKATARRNSFVTTGAMASTSKVSDTRTGIVTTSDGAVMIVKIPYLSKADLRAVGKIASVAKTTSGANTDSDAIAAVTKVENYGNAYAATVCVEKANVTKAREASAAGEASTSAPTASVGKVSIERTSIATRNAAVASTDDDKMSITDFTSMITNFGETGVGNGKTACAGAIASTGSTNVMNTGTAELGPIVTKEKVTNGFVKPVAYTIELPKAVKIYKVISKNVANTLMARNESSVTNTSGVTKFVTITSATTPSTAIGIPTDYINGGTIASAKIYTANSDSTKITADVKQGNVHKKTTGVTSVPSTDAGFGVTSLLECPGNIPRDRRLSVPSTYSAGKPNIMIVDGTKANANTRSMSVIGADVSARRVSFASSVTIHNTVSNTNASATKMSLMTINSKKASIEKNRAAGPAMVNAIPGVGKDGSTAGDSFANITSPISSSRRPTVTSEVAAKVNTSRELKADFRSTEGITTADVASVDVVRESTTVADGKIFCYPSAGNKIPSIANDGGRSFFTKARRNTVDERMIFFGPIIPVVKENNVLNAKKLPNILKKNKLPKAKESNKKKDAKGASMTKANANTRTMSGTSAVSQSSTKREAVANPKPKKASVMMPSTYAATSPDATTSSSITTSTVNRVTTKARRASVKKAGAARVSVVIVGDKKPRVMLEGVASPGDTSKGAVKDEMGSDGNNAIANGTNTKAAVVSYTSANAAYASDWSADYALPGATGEHFTNTDLWCMSDLGNYDAMSDFSGDGYLTSNLSADYAISGIPTAAAGAGVQSLEDYNRANSAIANEVRTQSADAQFTNDSFAEMIAHDWRTTDRDELNTFDAYADPNNVHDESAYDTLINEVISSPEFMAFDLDTIIQRL